MRARCPHFAARSPLLSSQRHWAEDRSAWSSLPPPLPLFSPPPGHPRVACVSERAQPRESERESVRSLGCVSRSVHLTTYLPPPNHTPAAALLFLTILGSGPKTLKPQSIQAPPDLSPESIYLCTSRDACHDPFLISPARLEIRLSERAVSNPVVPARLVTILSKNCFQSLTSRLLFSPPFLSFLIPAP